MKKFYLSALTSVALFMFSSIAQAEKDDELYEHGKTEHNANCVECHTDSVYTREDRLIKSKEALNKRVNRCKENVGVAWFEEDVDAVVHFLNEKYYKF